MAAFFRKADHANTDLLSNYAWYVPGIGGMFLMLGLLLLGALLGSLLVGAVAMATGLRASGDWSTLLSYPVMFIPPMLAAGNISMRNAVFENGYKLDSRHFGRLGGAIVALLCTAATFALAFSNAARAPIMANAVPAPIMGSGSSCASSTSRKSASMISGPSSGFWLLSCSSF